jgi:hypothetical protein
MSDTKTPREEVGVVVEHKTEGSTSYSGVLYASAILFDKVPPGTKLYVAAPDHREMVSVPRELQDEAMRCAFVLENIGSMDAEDIDGDDIDLRFEDEDGRDTGCDVSIVEYAERAAKVLRALLAGGDQ